MDQREMIVTEGESAQAMAMAYFASMPKKKKENPYWVFDREISRIITKKDGRLVTLLEDSTELLTVVRQYFRNVYHSFQTEAQVLCIAEDDIWKLEDSCIPRLGDITWDLCGISVGVFVLPQQNTLVNSSISEAFWQEMIIGNTITPVARIHSHHILEAYQSSTDYSTLNSNTLEIVMGRIEDGLFQVAFWLDEHGKDTKSFVTRQTEHDAGEFETLRIPCGMPKRTEDKR